MGRKKYTAEAFQTDPKKRSNFIQIFHDLFDSKAFGDLGPCAVYLYLQMLRKYTRRTVENQIAQSNKDEIVITRNGKDNRVREAKPYGEWKSNSHGHWSPNTFRNSIDELIDHGFIYLVKSQYSERKCNIYGFSDMWKYYGTKAFIIRPEHSRKILP